MAREIERKFLLKNDSWRNLAQGSHCLQGYLNSHPDRVVRVRIADGAAFLTIKGRNQGGCALEFEYPLPLGDARAMLAELAERPLVEKLRYRIPFRGLTWEVDEFLGDNQGLVLAEVELTAPDQAVEPPDWAGEEVTGDPRYFNSNLAKKPYKDW